MTEPGTSSLEERKRQARTGAKLVRAEAAAEDPVAAGYALCDRVLAAIDFPEGCVVSAYWPMSSEIDPRPLMIHLHEDGHPIALPVVAGTGSPLVFRAWRPEDPLEPAGFGTRVPLENQPELTPEFLIVPLLYFVVRKRRAAPVNTVEAPAEAQAEAEVEAEVEPKTGA